MKKIIKPIVSISTILMVAFSPFVALTPTISAQTWPNCDNWDCNANNAEVRSAWLGNQAGVILGLCDPSDTNPIEAYIWANIYNRSNQKENGWLIADLYIDNTPHPKINNSIGSFNSHTEKNSLLYGPISWICGQEVRLENIVIVWKDPGSCAAPTIKQCEQLGTIFVVAPTIWYRDADGDGYGDPNDYIIAYEQPVGYVSDNTDCDDTNANVHPGATEVCNGVDDDCDGQIDEGLLWANKGNECTVGVGECATQGTLICNPQIPAGELICSATPGTPTDDETCDGLDNDCDGSVDEDIVATPTSCGVGACAATGEWICAYGQLTNTCQPGTPSTEVCDGVVDEDCDGAVDEGCGCTNGNTKPCGPQTDEGECIFGLQTCIGGAWGTCENAVYPINEICDGLDNDCDGETDEGVLLTFYQDADSDTYGNIQMPTQACSVPQGYVSNSTDCDDTNGNIYPGATEVCNGVDDDCNALTEDGSGESWYNTPTTCGTGVCANTGQWVCQAGVKTDTCTAGTPTNETCDGLDNDCDGSVDEDIVATPTSCGVGVCASTGELICSQGSLIDTCQVGTPSNEVCDGQLDENCDGTVDEGCACTSGSTKQCGQTDVGLCEYGIQTCSGGVWGTCEGAIYPAEEICGNGIDEDCSGADLTCPPAPTCGDQSCNGSETCSTCPGDCGACPPVCLGCYGPPYCGDGIKNGSEECDDRNIVSGDGCSADCKTEGGLVAGVSTCNLDLDVMVVMDVSGSMEEDNPTRLFLAKTAANSFIDNLRSSDQSGLVSFNRTATLNKNLSYDHTVTKSIISGLTAGGSTNMGAAIDKANNELMSVANNLQLAKVEILLTDGKANRPNGDGFNENPADVALVLAKSLEAAENGIMIYTIGLGSDVNTGMLQTIADNTGGKYYFSPTSNDLNGIFSQIAAETCRTAFPTYVSPSIIIFNERAGAFSDTGATVTWYTNISATSRVVYGNQQMSVLGDAPNYGYAFSTPEQDSVSKVIPHSVTISGLVPNTTYYVRCVSQTAKSTELTFTTLGVGEVIPTISASEEGEVAGAETEEEVTVPTEPGAAGGEETFVTEGAEAAVGGFAAGTTLCWILFIVTILLSLWYLRLKRKGVENKNKRLILFVVVVLLILYYFICCVGCTTCCLKFWVLVVINAILFALSFFLKKKQVL